LAGGFVRQTPSGQLPQLAIDEWQQIRRRLFVAVADRRDDFGEVTRKKRHFFS
jgi:hypothetical protein